MSAAITFVFALSADAQNRKPKPLATPVPVLTGAEIISQDADLTSQAVVKPADTPTTKTDAATKAANRRALDARLKKLEAGTKNEKEEKQKALLMNLDILTRAEQRSENLRKQLFEMIDKENALQARLDQIEYDIRPESIERTLQLSGSMRPEEVRDNKRKSLEAERRNVQALLADVQSTRSNLSATLQRSDQLVQKLRTKIEADIDESLVPDSPPENLEDDQ